MEWKLDDSYLEKAKGKSRKIEGRKERPLPRWFWIDWLRPIMQFLRWDFAVMFGANEATAKAGYRLGFIVGGHAYVGSETLNHRDAIFYITPKANWTFFAVGPDGEVIPDEGGDPPGPKRFWVDIHPNSVLCSYLDGRHVVS